MFLAAPVHGLVCRDQVYHQADNLGKVYDQLGDLECNPLLGFVEIYLANAILHAIVLHFSATDLGFSFPSAKNCIMLSWEAALDRSVTGVTEKESVMMEGTRRGSWTGMPRL